MADGFARQPFFWPPLQRPTGGRFLETAPMRAHGARNALAGNGCGACFDIAPLSIAIGPSEKGANRYLCPSNSLLFLMHSGELRAKADRESRKTAGPGRPPGASGLRQNLNPPFSARFEPPTRAAPAESPGARGCHSSFGPRRAPGCGCGQYRQRARSRRWPRARPAS